MPNTLGNIKPEEKPKRKVAYEWVITMSNDDIFVLTENQYQYYKDNQENGKLFFEDFEINPSFIESAYRRPAEAIKDKYPCLTCNTNGYIVKGPTELETCPDCEGTGVKL